MRPRLLDLFCCAGGAAMGYHRAGFDVVGVDIEPMPNYPFGFHQADALDFPLDGFDAIHASPPCQAHSSLKARWRDREHADHVEATRERLEASGLPYVIENVVGAPLRNPIMLCGSSFGLDVRRHRLFESNVSLMALPCAHHWQKPKFDVYEHGRWIKSPEEALRQIVGETKWSPSEEEPRAEIERLKQSRSIHRDAMQAELESVKAQLERALDALEDERQAHQFTIEQEERRWESPDRCRMCGVSRQKILERDKARDLCKQQTADVQARLDAFQKALEEIARRPTTELNPEGVDQAAWSMQLIAQHALQHAAEIANRPADDSKIVSKEHGVEGMAQSLWDAVAEYQGLSGGRLPDSYRPLYETLARKALDTLDGERPSPSPEAWSAPDYPNDDPVLKILVGLRASYTPEGVGVWLFGRNKSLGGRRPIDLIGEGAGTWDVLAAVEQLAGGSLPSAGDAPLICGHPLPGAAAADEICARPAGHTGSHSSIGDASERLTEHEELTWKALRAYGDWIHPHRVQERITWTGSFSLVGEVLDALVAKGYAQINMSGQYYRARPAPSVPDQEAAHTSKYATGGNVYEDDGPPTASKEHKPAGGDS